MNLDCGRSQPFFSGVRGVRSWRTFLVIWVVSNGNRLRTRRACALISDTSHRLIVPYPVYRLYAVRCERGPCFSKRPHARYHQGLIDYYLPVLYVPSSRVICEVRRLCRGSSYYLLCFHFPVFFYLSLHQPRLTSSLSLVSRRDHMPA